MAGSRYLIDGRIEPIHEISITRPAKYFKRDGFAFFLFLIAQKIQLTQADRIDWGKKIITYATGAN